MEAPESPSKATILQWNSVMSRQGHSVSTAPERRDKWELTTDSSSSLRQSWPCSPGKENYPLSSEEREGRDRSRSPSKMSFFRNFSPERRGRGEGRARSVSPSKKEKRDESEKHTSQHKETCERKRSPGEINQEFNTMLLEMEVPSALCQKLMTLEPHVKESMMRGQATLSLGVLSEAARSKTRPQLPEELRKSKSSTSMLRAGSHIDLEVLSPPNRSALFKHAQSRSISSSSASGSSIDSCKGKRPASPTVKYPSSFVGPSAPRSRSGSIGSTALGSFGSANSSYFATLLKTTDSTRLDVAKIKHMRAVISSESPSWIGEFIEEGGYSAMVARLKELLDLEWREEQHDDQLLHELLRSFVALSTTDRGRLALQSMAPTPFIELSSLLFSEKRPGDLATRKLLVEMLILLADLPLNRQDVDVDLVAQSRETCTVSSFLGAESTNFILLFTLLHNVRDPTQEAKVDFIKASHAPRPFRTFVTELLNINRDYFWIFCHSNRFWSLKDINVRQVECPKVPGGMTGGVEYEAMAYLTSLMRLINTVCARLLNTARTQQRIGIAHAFHVLLFASGMERALATTRKASQTYYQPLHLELARYFDFTRQSRFQIPVELETWQSSPQLMTTEYRYFESDTTAKQLCQGKNSSPPVTDNRRTESSPETTERGAQIGLASGGTGRWLVQPKLSPAKRVGPPATSAVVDCRLNGSSVHQARGTPAVGVAEGDQMSQTSLVGDAVQRWEQLTARHPGRLGLDGALPR